MRSEPLHDTNTAPAKFSHSLFVDSGLTIRLLLYSSRSGYSPLLLKPKTTAEVSRILRYCHGRNLAVVPQGGNTSLAGGSVPLFDEVVISLKLMDKIISFNELSGTVYEFECLTG